MPNLGSHYIRNTAEYWYCILTQHTYIDISYYVFLFYILVIERNRLLIKITSCFISMYIMFMHKKRTTMSTTNLKIHPTIFTKQNFGNSSKGDLRYVIHIRPSPNLFKHELKRKCEFTLVISPSHSYYFSEDKTWGDFLCGKCRGKKTNYCHSLKRLKGAAYSFLPSQISWNVTHSYYNGKNNNN